jgi:alkylation response protein AidB-like acyl-CoA dehydrogenase
MSSEPRAPLPSSSTSAPDDPRAAAAEDHAELRAGVREVCARFPGVYWQRVDQAREHPIEFVRALTDAGYLAALIPREYGGLGLPLAAAAVILEEINASGCNAGVAHGQMYTMGAVLRHGSAAQKAAYLPPIARGELRLQVFGVTEPDSGSDTTRLRTTAVRSGDHYVVNGRKTYIGRAADSDLMLLLARTTPLDQVGRKTDGLSLLLVDMRDALDRGIEIRPLRTLMNQGAAEITLRDLRVPVENLIGEEGRGFHYILDGMNAERLLIAAECVGDARWFIEKSVAWANERVIFGGPIGRNQGVQFPIARAYAALRAARLMVREGCSLYDNGGRPGEEANLSLLLASEASWDAANAAVQTFGGRGFDAEYDIERKFRETRLYQVAPISRNLILSYVAVHVLGLPRSF